MLFGYSFIHDVQTNLKCETNYLLQEKITTQLHNVGMADREQILIENEFLSKTASHPAGRS